MSKTYQKAPCGLCGQIISQNGLSQTSHMKMHIREGYYSQIAWYPNEYERTSKIFDRELYQSKNPHKAYTQGDYFPSTGNQKDALLRKRLVAEMVSRKEKATA